MARRQFKDIMNAKFDTLPSGEQVLRGKELERLKEKWKKEEERKDNIIYYIKLVLSAFFLALSIVIMLH